MNEYERTRHEFDMRVLNDEKELELIKQRKVQERAQVDYHFVKDVNLNDREFEVIRQETKRACAEIQERSNAETKRIEAESELKA